MGYFLEYWLLVLAVFVLIMGLFFLCLALADKSYRQVRASSHRDIWSKELLSDKSRRFNDIASGNVIPFQQNGFHSKMTMRDVPVVRLVSNPMRQRAYARKRMYRMKVRLVHCQ